MTSAGHDDPFRALLDVGAALVSSSALDDALQNVAAAIGTVMKVATVDIQSWDRAGDRLVEEAYWSAGGVTESDREVIGSSIALDDHPTARRVLTERRVIELRADDPGLPAASRDALADWGLTTTLDGPLVIGDEVIGVIGVAEARFARRFLTMEIQLFEQLAGMAAAAMRNARLSRRERRFSLHLETLLGLSRRVSSEADPHTVASTAAEAVTRVLGASFAAVYEIGSDGGSLLERAAGPGEAPGAGAGVDGVPAAARRAAVTTALTEALLADGLDDAPSAAGPAPREGGPDVPPMLMAVTTAGIDDDVPDDMTALGEVTRLTVVTLRRGRPVTVLAAAWPERRGLDADDLDFARAIGDQVALAVDNDRLARA